MVLEPVSDEELERYLSKFPRMNQYEVLMLRMTKEIVEGLDGLHEKLNEIQRGLVK